MLYEFTRFPGAGRGWSSRASIRTNGQIGFNNGAVMHFALEEYDRAVLYYDPKNKVIGVQPVKTEEQGACRFVHRPGNSYVAAKSLFDYFEVPMPEETQRYDLWRDEDSGFLIMELSKPIPKKDRG